MKKVLIALGKALCYTALFIGMQLVVSMVYTVVGSISAAFSSYAAGGLDVDALIESMTAFVYDKALEITLVSNILTLLLLLLFFKIRKKSFLKEIYVARELPGLAYIPCALGGACLAGLVAMIMALLPIPEAVWQEYAAQSDALGDTGIIAVLASVLIAPLTEEIVFRGLVFTRLRRAMPWWVAMLISSAVFGLLHGQVLWMCYAFVMGLALCGVFERTGSVRASITAHLAFNLAGGYLLTGAPVSGYMAGICAIGATLCWIWLGRICPYTKLRPEG